MGIENKLIYALTFVGILTLLIYMILYYQNPSFTIILMVFVTAMLINFVTNNVLKKSLPISHNIAILGFPKSGKTTLIISLFGDIFAGKILSVRATPIGSKSIERINESLKKLRQGRALGPTKDQDRFGFRAVVTVKSGIFPRTYKVDFGDFPGEDSEDYSNENGSWLHKTEFFKWVVDSDAIIFVIDIGYYLIRRKDYAAEMTSALRAAWQNFLDLNDHRKNEVRKFPFVLAFTKADLFGVNRSFEDSENIEMEIMKIGFGDETPPIEEINTTAFYEGRSEVMNDFNELIQYFNNESSHFQVLFVSSFGLYNRERLGISELLQAVLP